MPRVALWRRFDDFGGEGHLSRHLHGTSQVINREVCGGPASSLPRSLEAGPTVVFYEAQELGHALAGLGRRFYAERLRAAIERALSIVSVR